MCLQFLSCHSRSFIHSLASRRVAAACLGACCASLSASACLGVSRRVRAAPRRVKGYIQFPCEIASRSAPGRPFRPSRRQVHTHRGGQRQKRRESARASYTVIRARINAGAGPDECAGNIIRRRSCALRAHTLLQQPAAGWETWNYSYLSLDERASECVSVRFVCTRIRI